MTVSARTEGFEVELRRAEGGAVLTLEGSAGAFELHSEVGTFWAASLRDAHGQQAILDGSGASREATVDRTGDRVEVELTWRDEPVELHEECGTATTTLVGRIEADEPTVYWSAELAVTGVAATLQAFTLPAVDDVRRPGSDRADDHLVLPDGWGLDIADPFDDPSRAKVEGARYPGASCTMQFLSLVNGGAGLYVAAHDPEGRPKSMTAMPDGDTGTLGVEITHLPTAVTEPTATFELPYEVATGTFAGDWYDAANRYREWVLDDARWTRRGSIADREDVPDWFRDRCLWWLLAPRETDHERDLDLIDRLREAFPVPTAVHWYTWHRGPFDVDYPDYFPPQAGWREAVAELEAAGVTVVPYVNARIADPNGETWRRQQLERAAARGASARLDPPHRPLQQETYDDQVMVAMCPGTATWRETIADVAGRLLRETPVRSIYLDQLSAYAPPPCHAPGHDHPPGGGTYGIEGYRALLATIRERARSSDSTADPATEPTPDPAHDAASGPAPDAAPDSAPDAASGPAPDAASGPTPDASAELAITSENNAEVYLDLVDGHLLWNSARSDLVPLFPAVYGEYTFTFGRQFFAVDVENDGPFRSKLAQSIVFGAQPGWASHHVAERLLEDGHETDRRYLRDAVETIDAIGGVHVGRRLRDPDVRGARTRTVRWEMHRHGRWDVDLDEVLAGLWRPDDGSGPGTVASLLVTNWADRSHEVTLALASEHVRPADVSSVRTVGAEAVDVLSPGDGAEGRPTGGEPDGSPVGNGSDVRRAGDRSEGPLTRDGKLRARVPGCTTVVFELLGPDAPAGAPTRNTDGE
jgi:hypothetical protein